MDFPPQYALDLTNCEQEPIRMLGWIQPHGVLLVLAEPDLQIIHISDNLFDILGARPCGSWGSRQQRLRAALTTYATTTEREQAIIQAACATFITLDRWLLNAD